jgi:hypothetical protein
VVVVAGGGSGDVGGGEVGNHCEGAWAKGPEHGSRARREEEEEGGRLGQGNSRQAAGMNE